MARRSSFSRSNGGANAIFINTDTRTYRDIRLKTAGSAADDTGTRAATPNRTVMGATQLAWLEQTLLSAQKRGHALEVCQYLGPHRPDRTDWRRA